MSRADSRRAPNSDGNARLDRHVDEMPFGVFGLDGGSIEALRSRLAIL